MKSAKLTLNEVEDEIKKAEEYLLTNVMHELDQNSARLTSKEKTSVSTGRRRAKDRPEIPSSRRKEILSALASTRIKDTSTIRVEESQSEEVDNLDEHVDNLLHHLCLNEDDSEVYFASDILETPLHIQESQGELSSPKNLPKYMSSVIEESSYPKSRRGRKSNSAKEKEETTKKVREKYRDKRLDECTFKPKLTKYTPIKKRATGRQRIEELSQSKEHTYAKWEQKKAQQEQQTMKKYPFRPQINPRTTKQKPHKPSQSPRLSSDEEQSVINRLHLEGNRRIEIREEAKRVLEELDLAQYPFQPKINRATFSIVDMQRYRPIHERLSDVQREKMERIQSLRHQVDVQESQKLVFKPRINSESRRIALAKRHQKVSAKSESTNVTDRLVRDAELITEKRVREIEEYERETGAELLFHPQICDKTQEIVEHKPEFQMDFVDRQQVIQQQAAAKFERKLAKEEATDPSRAPCTFKPDIGNTNRILECTRADRLHESSQDRVDRLSKEHAHIQQKRAQLEGDYYAQFNYQPEINPLSKIIGRASSVDELVTNERTKRRRNEAALAVQEQLREECSFKPKLRSTATTLTAKTKSTHLNFADPSNVLEQIAKHRQEKQQRIEKQRREYEYEELKACTFRPRTNKPKRKSSKPVVVRGLGRFLELKELKKQQLKEQEAREKKAFSVNYTTRSYTVPKPFSLSYQYRKASSETRQKKLKQHLEQQRLQECTFHPVTMEATNRQIIQQLLNDATTSV